MLKIERLYLPFGTVGKVTLDGEFICYSLERPWLDNKKDVSCIPTGIYDCIKKVYTSKSGDKYPAIYFMAVPGRTGIYVHRFNRIDESKGCIAFGISLDCTFDSVEIYGSKLSLNKVLDLLPDSFQVEIK